MIKKEKLLEELKKIDIPFIKQFNDNLLNPVNDEEKEKKLENEIAEIKKFSTTNIIPQTKAVLGLDIYKYSSYEAEKQNLIPFVFDLIKDEATEYVNNVEPTLFGPEYKPEFISTGDGGFLIFDTPLHALIFNFYFHAALHLFNTGHFFPKLSQYIGEIIIRSAMTYDNVFHYNNNFYGKGIILNSRILNRDKLNRFLIDEKVYYFFNRFCNGLETLPIFSKNDVKEILNHNQNDNFISWYIDIEKSINQVGFFTNPKIRNVHIQKIDDLFEKNTQLTLYNVEIQIVANIIDDKDKSKDKENNEVNDDGNDKPKGVIFILTIGNTNSLK
jgi:6-pyruvoyl-tetrahydropterin synthase